MRSRAAAVAALLACLGGIAAGVGYAAFLATTANPTSSVSAGTLEPPTNFAVAWTPNVGLAWTATPTTWASGTGIERAIHPGGPFSQIAQATPRTTATYADTPGAGTFYYRARSYLSGTTWVSTDTPVVSRQDSTFVFKSTTAFTASGNCDTGAQRERDMQQGFTPADPEETLARSGGTGTLNFCSDTFSSGQVMAAGTTTVRAYVNNSSGSTCNITAALKRNGVTTLGSGTVTIPSGSPTALRTWSFATSGVTFAAGDRLNLYLTWQGVMACNSTFIRYDGATTNSRVTVPSIDGYAATVLGTAGLVSFWRLGETSGATAADSTGTNPGTYVNGVTLNAASLVTHDTDPAASFDGVNDYVTVPDSASMSPTSAMSLEAWVKPSDVSTYRTIGTKDWLLRIDNPAEGNEFSFFVHIGGGWEPRVKSGVVPTTNTTYHVVGTYDGSNLRIYVNGQLKATQARTGSIDDGTGAFNIGVSPWWSGPIDDVALYNVALSATQIQAHYDAR